MAGQTGAAEALFVGRGDMAGRCRALDWSATPLGPIDSWPECLHPVIRTCLGAPAIPMAIWIGPERIVLYNEGYVPLLGPARHPSALGQPAHKVWPEVWPRLGPVLDRVIEHGESIQCEDERFWRFDGDREDAFYTCSFTPIRDARDQIVGAFSILQETTQRVRSTSQQHAFLSFALTTLRAGALDTGADWSLECRIMRADGEVRWVWISGRPADLPAQRGRLMSGIIQDITRRKQAEEALRTSEARLKFVQDAA